MCTTFSRKFFLSALLNVTRAFEPAILVFVILACVASVHAQSKGKPGGGGGTPCPTYANPTSDNSFVGTSPGNLDGAFNFSPFGAPSSIVVADLAVQADGKTVLFGSASSPWSLFVARLNQDGSLDTSFGSTGPGYTLVNFLAATHFPGGGAILPSGKILVGGWINYSGGGVYESVLAQLNDDGTLDSTFGNNGKLEIYSSRTPIALEDIAVQPDGKILLAGSDLAFTVVRVLPNGVLDASFGTGGFASSSANGFSAAIAVQSSGRIVLGGWSKKKTNDLPAFTLAAFSQSGQVDTSFGTSGRAAAVFSEGSSQIRDIAVDSSNRIVAVGSVATACGGGSDSAFARFTASGSLDTSFSSDGKHSQEVYGGFGNVLSVAISLDGRIATGGAVGKSDTTLPQDLSIIVLNSDGSLDATFGPGMPGFFPSGIVTLRRGTIGTGARGVAIHNNQIITGGTYGSNQVFARYQL